MKYCLNTDRLANLVREKRGSKSLRDIAPEIGDISTATLSRVENGKMPDMETFLILCNWLDVPPSRFFCDADDQQPIDTPEAIAIALRKNLDPAAANVLVVLVKAAYQEFSRND